MSDWFEKKSYGQAVHEAADRFGDRVALSFGDRSWSFTELATEVDRSAGRLDAAGVKPGEVVGLWLDNRPEWLFVFFGAAQLGAVVLPLNTGLRSDDCRYVLAHSRCSTLILAPRSGPVDYLDILDSVRADLPGLRRVILVDDDAEAGRDLRWSELDPGVEPIRPVVEPDGLATIMYTSGTTGAPKGVMQSHHALRNVTDQANRLNVRESDVIVMFLPLFHAYGLYEGPFMSVLTGARMCLLERFDAGRALAAIEVERATLCFGFSTHFQDMVEHPSFVTTDRSSLRAGILAVGPRSLEALARRVQREFGGKVVSGFGMTEIGVGATLGFLDEDEEHSAATSGYPLSGYEFRIVDPGTGELNPTGLPGEVHVRGYQVMLGYLDDPEQTAQTVDEDGWLHTGDVGVRAEDGYIRILGRYKDMLRVAGENVDPAEVETLYGEHDAVASAVLVGVPDARLEEVPCLCVQLREGLALDDELRAELLSYADGRLAAFKRPRHVVAFDRLPVTASGKTARAEIKELAREQVAGVVTA